MYNNDNVEKLMKEFPSLFQDYLKGCPRRLHVPDGWYNLAQKLLSDISSVVESDKELKNDFFITQIKEKFGGLRVYVSVCDKKIQNLIDEAEHESYKTCASCAVGDSTMKSKHNFIIPLCNECGKKLGYKDVATREYKRNDCILGEITDDRA